jgi:GNAT superfamily N-acetyltransferase
MMEIHKITSDNVDKLQDLYNEFKDSAKDYYNFDTTPLDFIQFKKGIIIGILKGFYATIEDKPAGFLFYVIEEHRSVEINIVHITEEFRGEDIEIDLLEEFLDEIKETPGWDVISYPMLGGQSAYVNKITHLGFKLVGQAIVRFHLDDIICPQIVTKLKLPELPEGYSISSWKPEYLEDVSNVIYESFHTAPDALFDPRFRTYEGCKKIVTMLVNSIMGDFLPDCTSVLIEGSKPVGVCFANLTNDQMGNIPLVGLLQSAQGKGLSIQLLKKTLEKFIHDVIEARLDCMEVNATVETDNFPALRMYRKVGFREDYNYPHAYMENENREQKG